MVQQARPKENHAGNDAENHAENQARRQFSRAPELPAQMHAAAWRHREPARKESAKRKRKKKRAVV
ncbi:hypothetical protein AB4Z48_36720 [Cupriavidus sp. 2TAF22]|uniref:hypothetical protein n=1 Tax=unclassified Cupriavidus TaxID=2640874 RepID=UPI003F8E77FF